MVAVRVSPDHRPRGPRVSEVAARLGAPSMRHFRLSRDEIYRWEFEKGEQSLTVAVNRPLIVDDEGLAIRAALDAVGEAHLSEERAAPHLATGALLRVLEPWCSLSRFFLYYPSRRQQPAALSPLIERYDWRVIAVSDRPRSGDLSQSRSQPAARVRNRLAKREISS